MPPPPADSRPPHQPRCAAPFVPPPAARLPRCSYPRMAWIHNAQPSSPMQGKQPFHAEVVRLTPRSTEFYRNVDVRETLHGPCSMKARSFIGALLWGVPLAVAVAAPGCQTAP